MRNRTVPNLRTQLRQQLKVILEIEGHTDSVGTDEYNKYLSERRAESVGSYLVSHNIAAASVSSLGLGEVRPVATNDTAAGRQQNRRRRAGCIGRSHRHSLAVFTYRGMS